MNNKMITIPYADAIEYGENTSALFKALWELTDLIRLESDLKKHHRAYLHVREDIDEKVKEARQIMTKVAVDMIGFYFKVDVRFLYKGIIIKHNKTEPTYTKTSLFLCEKRRFFMARTEKGVVTTI